MPSPCIFGSCHAVYVSDIANATPAFCTGNPIPGRWVYLADSGGICGGTSELDADDTYLTMTLTSSMGAWTLLFTVRNDVDGCLKSTTYSYTGALPSTYGDSVTFALSSPPDPDLTIPATVELVSTAEDCTSSPPTGTSGSTTTSAPTSDCCGTCSYKVVLSGMTKVWQLVSSACGPGVCPPTSAGTTSDGTTSAGTTGGGSTTTAAPTTSAGTTGGGSTTTAAPTTSAGTTGGGHGCFEGDTIYVYNGADVVTATWNGVAWSGANETHAAVVVCDGSSFLVYWDALPVTIISSMNSCDGGGICIYDTPP